MVFFAKILPELFKGSRGGFRKKAFQAMEKIAHNFSQTSLTGCAKIG
jgi:hypothetical protein